MEDLEIIKQQVKEVIKFSQGISNPQVDELIETWYAKKKWFIDTMHGQLIYEYPEEVSFEISPKEQEMRVDDFIRRVETYWQNYTLCQFIARNREGFFSNEVVYPTITYMHKPIKIPKGMKLLKAFKYFENDPAILQKIQDEASMIIQENKITGHMCVSVHPLDFLSSSENNCSWRSCHALDGEYRSGNLSYMVDEDTIICYLKTNTDEKLPNFPNNLLWNNKKWRVLMFISNDRNMMFAGRQYPFASKAGIDLLREDVLKQAGFNMCWTPWTRVGIQRLFDEENMDDINQPVEYFLGHRYIPVGHKLKSMTEVIEDGQQSMNFNDLLNSSCYQPYFCYRTYDNRKARWCPTGFSTADTKFLIGGPVKCLECGKEVISISETMRCAECEELYGDSNTDNFGFCACCGTHINLDECYWVHDEPVCGRCGNQLVGECDCCGEYEYKEDMIFVRSKNASYCRYCYERYEEEEDE